MPRLTVAGALIAASIPRPRPCHWQCGHRTLCNDDYNWFTSFAGVDYIANDRWIFSALHNYAEADDFDDTGTIYEGIDMHTVTLGAAYYFMRNVKGVVEFNVDLLDKDDNEVPYVDHQTKENYFLIGIDLAY